MTTATMSKSEARQHLQKQIEEWLIRNDRMLYGDGVSFVKASRMIHRELRLQKKPSSRLVANAANALKESQGTLYHGKDKKLRTRRFNNAGEWQRLYQHIKSIKGEIHPSDTINSITRLHAPWSSPYQVSEVLNLMRAEVA